MTRSSSVFGDLRIDAATRELWRAGRLVVLPPQVFDCIAYLVEHRDRAVGRDELVAAVWGKTEVSDTLVGQTVMRIRRELGDDAKGQRIVRTIPRFGYRWVADGTVGAPHDRDAAQSIAAPHASRSDIAAPAGADAGAPAPGYEAHRARRSYRNRWLAACVVLAIVLGGVAYDLVRTRVQVPAGTTALPAARAAAVVLATLDTGMAVDSSWLRFGVMEVVASRLRSAGVPTAPSESVVALLNMSSDQRPAALRRAGEFGLLVRPRVSMAGADWQVHLDADDGAGIHTTVDAHARSATEASRLATDKLLVVLGHAAPTLRGEAEPYADLVKRIDAAVLADDPGAALALIDSATAAQRESPQLRLRLAKIDFRSGRTEAARARLASLLERAPASTDAVLRAEILNGLGAVAIRSDDPALAESYFAQAVALLETQNVPAQLGEAYLGRAAAAAEQRHVEAALADYARARVAMRQANDTLALLRVSANEGFLDLDQGRPAQALPQLVAASKGFEQWGAINEAIFTLVGQVAAQRALLRTDEALAAADAAERLAPRIESRGTLDALALARARALAGAGRDREARDLLGQVRDGSPPPDRATDAAAAVQLAHIALDTGHADAALQLLAPAADALREPGYVSRARRGGLDRRACADAIA